MLYNFVADIFYTQKIVADFLQPKCYFRRKLAVLRFWASFVGLEATYDDHLRLIGKRVVDFLLVLIELFFASCYAWCATSEYRFKVGDFAPTSARLTQNFTYKGLPLTTHSSSQKTRPNDLSYGIKIWTDLSSVLSQSTRLADGQTDGQTDRILIARLRLHSMQRGDITSRVILPARWSGGGGDEISFSYRDNILHRGRGPDVIAIR